MEQQAGHSDAATRGWTWRGSEGAEGWAGKGAEWGGNGRGTDDSWPGQLGHEDEWAGPAGGEARRARRCTTSERWRSVQEEAEEGTQEGHPPINNQVGEPHEPTWSQAV